MIPARAILPALWLLGLAACRGHARLELISLNYRAIDPPAPQVARLALDRCFWWTDDAGQLWIAMERRSGPLPGRPGQFLFQMSLALEKPPAGRARNYEVARRELRARALFGPTQMRLTSAAGIVAVYRAPGDRLRGSLRLRARRVVSRWLGGWGRPQECLIQGRFEAVHDARRGGQVALATESAGWGRAGRAASQRRAPARRASAPAAPAGSGGWRSRRPPGCAGRRRRWPVP